MDLIEKTIGKDDGTLTYKVMRAFCIGVLFNPLLWITVILVLTVSVS